MGNDLKPEEEISFLAARMELLEDEVSELKLELRTREGGDGLWYVIGELRQKILVLESKIERS